MSNFKGFYKRRSKDDCEDCDDPLYLASVFDFDGDHDIFDPLTPHADLGEQEYEIDDFEFDFWNYD